MDTYKRYGLYVVPTGPFFDAASAWLGWDSVAGMPVKHTDVAGLPSSVVDLTATPRKYGFHGTIKPPFVLAKGQTIDALHQAAHKFCARAPSVSIPDLRVKRLGRFVAIVPTAPSEDLAALAASTVEALDHFRAPPSDAELARRRKAGLSDRQEAMLRQWGYPYVMEEFRFHLTLSGHSDHAEMVAEVLGSHFAPVIPKPFVIESLAMMGEASDGRFHLLHRYPLGG